VTSTTILFELSKEALFLIATVVAPQVSPCILPGTLMTHVNHQGRSNTQDSIVHFYAMSVWPLGDFVYLSYLMIQENVASTRTKESFPIQHTLHHFLCSPSFHKSRDKISFKGEGCNTLYYGSPNPSLITVISILVMHYMS
jgi:hypothetical protein